MFKHLLLQYDLWQKIRLCKWASSSPSIIQPCLKHRNTSTVCSRSTWLSCLVSGGSLMVQQQHQPTFWHSDIVTVSLVVTWSDQAETRQTLDLNKYLMSRLPPDSRPGDRSHNNHTNYICTAIPVSAQVRNNLRFKKILFIISSISTKIASLRSVKGWPFKSRKENFNGCWSSRNDLLLRLQVL